MDGRGRGVDVDDADDDDVDDDGRPQFPYNKSLAKSKKGRGGRVVVGPVIGASVVDVAVVVVVVVLVTLLSTTTTGR